MIPSIPIATGIAILRYRLYDIDILINRTLVYGSLTMMLALLYFGGVSGIQALFGALTAVLIRVDPAADSRRGRTNLPHLRA